MAELVAGKREQFIVEERRKSQEGFAQNSRVSSILWDSLDEQNDPKLVGCTLSNKQMDEVLKTLGSSPTSKFIEQTYLFMKAVQRMMVDLLAWNHLGSKRIKDFQEKLKDIHDCVDQLHTDMDDVEDLVNRLEESHGKKEEGRKRREQGNAMDAKSMYNIVAEQTKLDETELKALLMKELQQDKKDKELELLNQGKWNYCILQAISKVTKFRIVLFSARTRKHKDFGDLKIEQKVKIYVRGSDCALMKKGAKSNKGRNQGHQRPYPHRGQRDAYAGPQYYFIVFNFGNI